MSESGWSEFLSDPAPLPAYRFDSALSADDNFLIWAAILCRHSSSRKGHMAALLVRPSDNTVLAYANNTPLLFNAIQKKAPEVHAEALCIARCARTGVNAMGATCYVTAPPCNECFMSLASAGVKRIVHVNTTRTESVRIAAHVLGIEIVGVPHGPAGGRIDFNAQTRDFWTSAGETAGATRTRVDSWWAKWMRAYKASAQVLRIAVQDVPNDGSKKRRLIADAAEDESMGKGVTDKVEEKDPSKEAGDET
ncbi:hypothetical protein BC830DRAFT_1089794 [Chytriomyces sp. MP71]|nr:hypothetical protein BC830DRAFT_1089794 [Chytriomyces sp. MP71]